MGSENVLAFIQRCVRERRLFWTYHINMRLKGRSIPRTAILESTDTFEIIESYPEDKYLPSYLVYFEHDTIAYHAVFAVDAAGENVRVVTAYRPDPDHWTGDLRRRAKP